MDINIKSVRTFIGAKDFNVSRSFYLSLGFEEVVISNNMSYFRKGNFGFYLQDYYTKDWIENSMIFIEVTNLENLLANIKLLKLHLKYKNIKLSEIVYNDWGKEFFLHDPSGVLLHFGSFN